MPWQTNPTFTTGQVLGASQLNVLSSNLEYLWGLVSAVNLPFNSLRTQTTDLSELNNLWLIKHAHRYLHFQARLISNDNDSFSIFYSHDDADYVRIYYDPTSRSASYTYSGYVDLNNPETWSDWDGAWSNATSYSQWDVVSHNGEYWVSKTGGNLNNEPPNATHWEGIGAAGAFAAVGDLRRLYVSTQQANNFVFVVDYLLESDSTTL